MSAVFLATSLREKIPIKYTRCDQKITVIFKFREIRMFGIRIFISVILVHMSVIYVTNISILDCQFVFDR